MGLKGGVLVLGLLLCGGPSCFDDPPDVQARSEDSVEVDGVDTSARDSVDGGEPDAVPDTGEEDSIIQGDVTGDDALDVDADVDVDASDTSERDTAAADTQAADTEEADTVPTLCVVNQHVVDGNCEACQGGSTNSAGDDPSAGDTSCDVPCDADYHVAAGVCVACPAGETNDSGDSPGGLDTGCDDFCAQIIGVSCPAFSEAYVKPSGISVPYGHFGRHVAISGDRMAVVGVAPCTTETMACCGDDGCETGAAVFIYERSWSDGQSSWEGAGVVRPLEQEPGDFISALALEGDRLVMGMSGEDSCQEGTAGVGGVGYLFGDNDCDGTGAVYIFGFEPSGGDWEVEAYLKGAGRFPMKGFGASVSLDEDRLAVGQVPLDACQSDPGCPAIESVYIYKRVLQSGVFPKWNADGVVSALSGELGDRFGRELALQGDVLVVGAPFEDSCDSSNLASNECSMSGAVYFYLRSTISGEWAQVSVLKENVVDAHSGFGLGLAWRGNEIVAASLERTRVFDVAIGEGGAFAIAEKASFGHGVHEAGELVASQASIILGQHLASDCGADLGPFTAETSNASCVASGRILVFEAQGDGSWVESFHIKGSNTGPADASPHSWRDQFGHAVALDGNTLVIGAPNEDSCAIGVNGGQDSDACEDSGAVYVRRIAP